MATKLTPQIAEAVNCGLSLTNRGFRDSGFGHIDANRTRKSARHSATGSQSTFTTRLSASAHSCLMDSAKGEGQPDELLSMPKGAQPPAVCHLFLIRTIQKLMGHRHIGTTALYC